MGYGIEHTAEMPVVGVTPRSTWAELLVDAIDELRATLDAKVTPAGIDINADLSFRSGSSYYAATNVNYIGLTLQSALANLSAGSYPGVIYKYAGNLYYNNDSGTQIAITSGASIAAAAGNITTSGSPAFGASGVEILWNGTDTAYEMRSGSGANDLADIKVDDVYLNDGSANYVRLHATGVGTDYTITVPAAPPGSTAVVQMGSTGVLSASTTADIATSGAMLPGTLSVSGTGIFDGLITADAGLTASVDQHITVSGTGTFKHGSRTLLLNPLNAYLGSFNVNGAKISATSSSAFASLSLPLQAGWHVSSVSVYWDPAGTGSKDMSIVSIDEAGTEVTVATRTFTSSSKSDYAVTDADFTVAAEKSYYLAIGAGDSGDDIHLVRIIFDQP